MRKEVHIRRRESKSHLPVPVISSSIKILGSIYDGQGPLRGISGDEEKKLLSKHLGIDVEDRDFPKAMREFWIDLRVKVPVDGVPLQIGVNSEGEPYNIKDFLVYTWAKRHKQVASNKAELDGQPHKKFYIHDDEIENRHHNAKVKMRKTAYMEFSKLDGKVDKMKMLIKVLDDVDVDTMTITDIENRLEHLINVDADAFVQKATDKNLETRALISDLISKNIIRKIGNSVFYIEEKLGDTEDDAITYLNDKKNSEMLLILKEKLKEFTR